MDNKPLVEIRNVSKTFPGVKALDDISFDIMPGKVHILMGENGAGKSTLIKAISGVYMRDEGSIFYKGKEINYSNSKQAIEDGISVIHQELSVIPDLTVAENIFLGRELKIGKTPFVDKNRMQQEAQKIIDDLGIHINAKKLIRKLNNADRQMVEIVSAVSKNSSLVIMDEPTSSLSEREVKALFTVIESLKKNNVAIIYISHRLKEIRAIGDYLTILRDGKHVITDQLENISEAKMIELMVGREVKQFYFKPEAKPSEENVLEVQNFTREGVFKDISFTLKKGEILGISGLIGTGRTEVMRAIFGADKIDSGKLFLNGKEVKFKSTIDAIKHGIGLIPEDRRNEGLLLLKSVKENTSLASLYDNSKNGFLNFKWEKNVAIEYISKLKTKTPHENTKVKNLSGGNQQKVVIAKWLVAKSKILIMDEPTRGIDVNAKAEIYALMKEFVTAGGSIIMVSSELPEVLGMSHRIIVMREGMISGILDGEGASEQSIMQLASINK